jgi:hypothetical protein
MPLEESRCERILTLMKSMDVETRLKAINEARVENLKCFNGELSDKDWAYSAYYLETQYNLVREELRVKQIRVKADSGKGDAIPVNATPKSPKAKAKVKDKPAVLDMGTAMKEFAAMVAAMEAKKKEDSNVADSQSSET